MRTSLALACGLFGLSATAAAADPPVDYNRDIRPILSSQCYACHGPDDKTLKGGLRLDLRDEAVAAKALVPGKPDESELLKRIISKDTDEQMPPPKSKKPPLTPEQVELVKRWIAEGAKYSDHWSFTKITRPAVPAVKDAKWGRNPIDAFLLAKIEAAGKAPSAEADRITLIRRLSLDLTGLPPSVEDVRAFVADQSPTAYEKVVDTFLASPHYGERMAVQWLDLVRYADSIGYHSDNTMNVSPYRDYVIRAFNENLPFDQFTREQLAGDLLPNPTQWQKVATAYNRLLQTTEEGGAQAKEYEAKNSSDRVRNYGQVWLGGTVMCAECHNHKFDPYSQKDFYSLAAFFADIKESAIGKREAGMPFASPENEKELARLEAAVAVAQKKFDEAVAAALKMWDAEKKLLGEAKVPAEIENILAAPAGKRPAKDTKALNDYLAKSVPAVKEASAVLIAAQTKKTFMDNEIRKVLVTTSAPPRTVRILNRGNWQDTKGEVVTPAVPAFLPPLPKKEGRYTRLDLAEWTVSKENPLTSRVFVNRTWKLFFGRGISKSLEETGAQGELPTHPELLDWLASEFREGWDVKQLVRLIVTSLAYRQSSRETVAVRETDPNNRLFSRQGRFRIEAEFVRDSSLAVSGLLVRTIGGSSVKPYQPPGYWASLNFPVREWQKDTGEKVYRRGMYTHWQRTFLHPAMMAFDAPSREECTCERPRSNIPQQALVLLNDPEFVEASRVFAAKAIIEGGKTDTERLNWAFERATSRVPTADESKILLRMLAKHREQYQADPKSAELLTKVGDATVPKDAAPAELGAWISVCRVILNLHETVTRE